MKPKLIPILFSTMMVQAILDNRKTVTRRIADVPVGDHNGKDIMDWGLSRHPWFNEETGKWEYSVQTDVDDYYTKEIKYTYGHAGDILWVKETFYSWGWWVRAGKTKTGKQKWRFVNFTTEDKNGQYHYFDNPPSDIIKGRPERKMGWYKRPSLFMPFDAARIFLKRTITRIERLHDITEDQAIAEGIEYDNHITGRRYKVYTMPHGHWTDSATGSFSTLWDKINGTDSLKANPWVWVVEFERTEKPEVV